MTDFLIEPSPAQIAGEATVPGDKSIGHRAVLFGALCDGDCEITGLSGGEDNLRTVAALEAMGVPIRRHSLQDMVVGGVGLRGLKAPDKPLDCGNSGTSIRLLAGLLAAQPFVSTLVGDEYLTRRPMRRVTEPLTRMGARIRGAEGKKPGECYPPLKVGPCDELRGIEYVSPVASAQVKSAILIAGLYAQGATTVREPGPSRDHTERMLAYLGAPVERSPSAARIRIGNWDGRLGPRPLPVPGDPSSAAFLLAAALVAGRPGVPVVVRGVCVNGTRTGYLDVFSAMGAIVEQQNLRNQAGEPVADLVVSGPTPGGLKGVDLGGELIVRTIDEVPIVAILASRANGTTRIRDAAELRVKESDRIATTVGALRSFGVDAEEQPDGLVVHGLADRPLRAGDVDSAGDHRIAMAAAVGALAADGPTRVRNVDNVATSFPTFSRVLTELGAAIATIPSG
jgi:3-phosphoshikimate 1-carboxyvinyltransferase